jgi:hypothetical protein
MFYSPAFTFSSIYPLGFCRVPGFALGCCASFKRFWPLALVQQVLPAIILQALRRLRGAVLFRSLRPSSSWGFPCWLLGLTVQSSRPAFCGRLTSPVSTTETQLYFAHAFSNGIQLLKRCAALGLPFFRASPAWAAQVSSLFGL